MKRLLLAGILLISLAMAMSPLTAAYKDSQRETISAITGSNMQTSYGIRGALFYDNNVTLPWAIGDFDHALTMISFHADPGPTTFTGFWNDGVFGATNLNATHLYANETITIAISNGMDASDTWSHINVSANNTNWEATVFIYLSDVETINSVITYTEADKTDPNVGKFWPVNDTATFGTLPFDMNLYLKLDYPSTAVGTPDLYPWNGTTVGSADFVWVEYQKYGPAHGLDEKDVEGAAGTVTATFDSNDKLDDATWDIKFSDAEWQGFFAGATSPVTVKVDGEALDADDVELTTTGLALKNVQIDNDKDIPVVFTWTTSGTGTTPPATTPPATDVFAQEAVSGVPNWALMGIALIVVIAGIAIYKNEKK